MADDVFPVFDVVKPITESATGWSGYPVWLSMSPRTDQNVLDLTASAMVQPYRKLADGTIEMGPERLRKSFAFGSL